MSNLEPVQFNEVKTPDTVTLTPAAVDAVKELFAKQELVGYALRVFAQGGGCSGIQLGMALENNIRDTDTVFGDQDVKVVVDEVSINYWLGATIDFVNNGIESGFKIENPNPMGGGCSCSSDSDAASANSCGSGSGSCCS
ncbi:MAG: iron-sulfur cluster assembly accessory protein [Chloroflexota bacterium]